MKICPLIVFLTKLEIIISEKSLFMDSETMTTSSKINPPCKILSMFY